MTAAEIAAEGWKRGNVCAAGGQCAAVSSAACLTLATPEDPRRGTLFTRIMRNAAPACAPVAWFEIVRGSKFRTIEAWLTAEGVLPLKTLFARSTSETKYPR